MQKIEKTQPKKYNQKRLVFSILCLQPIKHFGIVLKKKRMCAKVDKKPSFRIFNTQNQNNAQKRLVDKLN